jgi:hypothetical protein
MDNYGRIRKSWAKNSELKDDYGRLCMSWAELQNRRLQVRFLSHLPRMPEFIGLAAPMAPAHCVCVDPYVTPPEATPRVSECSTLGDGLLGIARGSRRLRPAISKLAMYVILLGPNLGSRSYPVTPQ